MAQQTRQLAAIMFTDIVGYTALMGKDSAKAMELVRISKEIQKPLVEKHNGKWLKEMGDGAMARFITALDAVNCSIDIQDIARSKLDAKLRIGIHLGDVTIENNDVYGDGVNVASRLESIADPGGVYISDSIEKAIRGQANVQTKYLGEAKLKNVSYGVRTYALQAIGLPIPEVNKIKRLSYFEKDKSGDLKSAFMYITLASLLIVGGWWIWPKFNGSELAQIRSIAVLPFDDFSQNQDQEYLAAGLHDNLITTLSQVSSLRVIGKTSTLRFKNTNKSNPEIAAELGVDALIEASIMKVGDTVRINVQLIKVLPEEQHLWAKLFDEPTSNILSMFNGVTKSIAEEINITLSPQEKSLLDKSGLVNPEAWEAYLQGKYSMGLLTRDGIDEALVHFQKAIELDPEFAPAYGGLAGVWGFLKQMNFISADQANPNITKNLNKALELDSTLAEVFYWDAGNKIYMHYNWKEGEQSYKRAIELNPNFSIARGFYANFLSQMNRFNEADEQMEIALSLDPYNPLIMMLNALLQMNKENYYVSIEALQPLQKNMPANPLISMILFICYAQTEQYDQSIAQAKIILELEKHGDIVEILENEYEKSGYSRSLFAAADALEREDSTFVASQTMVYFYALSEDTDKTLDWIEKGFIRKDPKLPALKVVPILKPYHDEPRFIEIANRMKFPY